jgi:hypothetical protein
MLLLLLSSCTWMKADNQHYQAKAPKKECLCLMHTLCKLLLVA